MLKGLCKIEVFTPVLCVIGKEIIVEIIQMKIETMARVDVMFVIVITPSSGEYSNIKISKLLIHTYGDLCVSIAVLQWYPGSPALWLTAQYCKLLHLIETQ